MTRILWIAVADARGHLMRAHRARRLLAPSVEVDVVTTSDAGVAFLAALGTPARRLGRGYALAFDAQQHLERARTHGRLLRYLARDAAGDVLRLRRWAEDYDLIVDDALHPASLIASLMFDPYAVPIVHVFGTTLLEAVVEIGGGRRECLRSRTISTRSPQRDTRSAPGSPGSEVRGARASAARGPFGTPSATVDAWSRAAPASSRAPNTSFEGAAPASAREPSAFVAAVSRGAPAPSRAQGAAVAPAAGARRAPSITFAAGASAVSASSRAPCADMGRVEPVASTPPKAPSADVGRFEPGSGAPLASSRAPTVVDRVAASAALASCPDRAASTPSRPGLERLGDEVPSGLLARLLERALRRAFASIEYAVDAAPDGTRLRPLVDPPRRSREAVRRELGVHDDERLVVAYLNPHFSDPRLAAALESAPGRLYAVGEGFAERTGWVAHDGDLADKLAAADVVVSAPGVATLTAVKASGVPYVALRSRQPEQQKNLARLGRGFEVVDVTTPELLPAAIERARRAPPGEPTSTIAGDWRRTLHLLIDERNHRCAAALHWSSKPTT